MSAPNSPSVSRGSGAVHRLLVTAELGPRMDTWAATALFANWIEGRENWCGDVVETWLVTCFDEQFDDFLNVARQTGVTVEEISSAGDDEGYALVVGEPGTGWVKS